LQPKPKIESAKQRVTIILNAQIELAIGRIELADVYHDADLTSIYQEELAIWKELRANLDEIGKS